MVKYFRARVPCVFRYQIFAGQRKRRQVGFIALFAFLGMIASVDAAPPPPGPLGLVWEADLAESAHYDKAVEGLLQAYEASVGTPLRPADRGQVGLKVNTRAGRGLSTPPALLRAVINGLEKRGYQRESIFILDDSARALRQAGILPPLSHQGTEFAGCRVIGLDQGSHYDAEWYYDSPLPPTMQQEPRLIFGEASQSRSLEAGNQARKSFLPMPLMFEVDFWINLAVGVDDPALGVDGVLANATLWNVSNSHRFLGNPATASAAVAEIAAIPELRERMVLHFVSLERYQYIGGPFFKSLYTRSEPRLWMSSDPVALDRLLLDRMNAARLLQGFPEISPLPRQLQFASSLGLGEFQRSRIRIQPVETVSGR